MMKQEFERLVGATLSDEEWEKVSTVYLWYSEKFNKETIAQLWHLDKKIIFDLYPRAKKIENIHSKIEELKKKIRELEDEMHVLQTQPFHLGGAE